MTRVKICGITNLEDAVVAIEAGADMLGFIFYPASPRYVPAAVVKEIVVGVRDWLAVNSGQWSVVSGQSYATGHTPRTTHHVTFVGVFVDEPLGTVAHALDFCGLDAAQLHGEEPPEFVNHFQRRAFKALRPQSPAEAEQLIQKYQPSEGKDEGRGVKGEIVHSSQPPIFQYPYGHRPSNLPSFLLDAYHPALYGGTGNVADWVMAAKIAQRYPILLAGSLTPENVAEAVRVVQPWGVDVSSGVEREKGKKDHAKVRALVEAVKELKRKT